MSDFGDCSVFCDVIKLWGPNLVAVSGQVRINKEFWKAEGDMFQQQIILSSWLYFLNPSSA